MTGGAQWVSPMKDWDVCIGEEPKETVEHEQTVFACNWFVSTADGWLLDDTLLTAPDPDDVGAVFDAGDEPRS